ncbi:geranylgeranyl pyrophosphate synthase [Cellulomonas chitinilytica]|uniref:Geranylgeranyl pyrophosphate synthase n=1 Tax=Cellulomonas chitinilytica TaxID=398759 RepID=A0A919NZC0_9CELL|nr:polyprenyl synthetase family protein [Cellulomonas chitinilytica]GIG20456.1 geranylgeranyl pyrophosphate synthase [Cellulomonas chitinilytica]
MTAQVLDRQTFPAFFAAGAAGAADAESRALWDAMAGASAGGKRLRPTLLLATYDALGGTRADVARHVADAVELLHTAFVMHDDVIDHDLHRRGRPNVSGAFEARGRAAGASAPRAHRYGQAAGILAGDLALVGAARLIATTDTDRGTVARLLALLDETVRVTAGGELGDVRLGLGVDDPSLAEVLTVEEHKTAVYSFSLPMQAGAVLADAPADLLPRLDRLGRLLGIAFQLQDDLLGTFGDEAVTGKSTLSDLREGTVTALVAHARTTAAWPVVALHLGDPDLTAAAADDVRDALTRSGSRQAVEDLVAQHVREARLVARDTGPVAGVVERLTADLLAPVGRTP